MLKHDFLNRLEMMNVTLELNDRQKAVLQHVLNYGRCKVGSLSLRFDVSEQTIRSDLNKLCDLKLLQRTHGGAMSINGFSLDGVENTGYQSRQHLNSYGKKVIGQIAATIIPNNSSLFINIGTTTECVADALKKKIGLLVVTNNINIANKLRFSENIKIMTAGGVVRQDDGGIVGEATIDFIEQFRLDYAIIGISAIDIDGTLLDFDFREIRVNKAIIKNARSVILVADTSKFDRKASVRLSNLSKIDYFVTDKNPPISFLNVCKEYNVKVQIAEQFDFIKKKNTNV